MATLLRRPKILIALIVLGILFVAGLAGGALGNEFGGGFIGAPILHLQVASEALNAEDILPGFKITNTMVATWLTIAVLVVLAYFATRRVREVPRGLQSLFEVIIEFFLNLAESVAGPERARRFLPLVLTIFIFIMSANWIALLPGFGTIGKVESPARVVCHEVGEVELEDGRKECPKLGEVAGEDKSMIELHGFDRVGSVAIMSFGSIDDVVTADRVDEEGNFCASTDETGRCVDTKRAGRLVPFLRSANTDINMTLAIAMVAMFSVHWWGIMSLGIFGYGGKFLNFKAGAVGIFVGALEGISEVARIISFTFRLFGNIFAGEVLLATMAFLVPLIGIIPFMGLELFVGMIQAFIFAMLTLVFASAAILSHGGEEHGRPQA